MKKMTKRKVILVGAVAFAALAGFWIFFDRCAFDRGTACVSNLHHIHMLKQLYIQAHHSTNGEPITAEGLRQFCDVGLFKCPDGGVYSINPVGSVPVCSFSAEWKRKHPNDRMVPGKITSIRHELFEDMEARDGLQ